MTEPTELLALILPPQGRLVVAAAASAGLLPGPGLVLALEHKGPAGSQTVAGLLDRQRAQQLMHTLGDWLVATQDQPATSTAEAEASPAQVMVERPDGGVEVLTDGTVEFWLQSSAEGMDL